MPTASHEEVEEKEEKTSIISEQTSSASAPKHSTMILQAPPQIVNRNTSAGTVGTTSQTATMMLPTATSSSTGALSSLSWMPAYAHEFGGVAPPLLQSQAAFFANSGVPSLAAAASLLRSTSAGPLPTTLNPNTTSPNTPASATLNTQLLTSSATTQPDWLQQLAQSTGSNVGLDSQLLQQSVAMAAAAGLLSSSTTTDTTPKSNDSNNGPSIQPMPEFPSKSKKDRIYIDKPGMWDVKCGRGGDSNHHSGNKRYRQMVSDMKLRYRNIEAKTAKTDLSRSIVAFIESYGGRFIKMDPKKNQHYLLSKQEARRKTSQALRETKETKWLLDPAAIAGEVAKEQMKQVLGDTTREEAL